MEDLSAQTEMYVKTLFDKHAASFLIYHNLSHTLRVVEHVHEIGLSYNLPAPELQIIKIAAWFHDVGHLFGTVRGHEQVGVNVMRKFLSDLNINTMTIDRIAQYILVTEFPSEPHNLGEQIICDADTYHLGTKKFKKYDALVRHEMMLRGMSTANWDVNTLKFLNEHRYFTGYCQALLNPVKSTNISVLNLEIHNKK